LCSSRISERCLFGSEDLRSRENKLLRTKLPPCGGHRSFPYGRGSSAKVSGWISNPRALRATRRLSGPRRGQTPSANNLIICRAGTLKSISGAAAYLSSGFNRESTKSRGLEQQHAWSACFRNGTGTYIYDVRGHVRDGKTSPQTKYGQSSMVDGRRLGSDVRRAQDRQRPPDRTISVDSIQQKLPQIAHRCRGGALKIETTQRPIGFGARRVFFSSVAPRGKGVDCRCTHGLLICCSWGSCAGTADNLRFRFRCRAFCIIACRFRGRRHPHIHDAGEELALGGRKFWVTMPPSPSKNINTTRGRPRDVETAIPGRCTPDCVPGASCRTLCSCIVVIPDVPSGGHRKSFVYPLGRKSVVFPAMLASYLLVAEPLVADGLRQSTA